MENETHNTHNVSLSSESHAYHFDTKGNIIGDFSNSIYNKTSKKSEQIEEYKNLFKDEIEEDKIKNYEKEQDKISKNNKNKK